MDTYGNIIKQFNTEVRKNVENVRGRYFVYKRNIVVLKNKRKSGFLIIMQ